MYFRKLTSESLSWQKYAEEREKICEEVMQLVGRGYGYPESFEASCEEFLGRFRKERDANPGSPVIYKLNRIGEPFAFTATIWVLGQFYELLERGKIDLGISFQIEIIDPEESFSYSEYLGSPEWREKAESAKDRAGQRCQVCNASRSDVVLDTHHRTYDRIGHEDDSDLIVLCRDCHDIFHKSGKLAR